MHNMDWPVTLFFLGPAGFESSPSMAAQSTTSTVVNIAIELIDTEKRRREGAHRVIAC